LPAAELTELDWLAELEGFGEPGKLPEVLLVPCEPVELNVELREITAKSIRPDEGSRMTSLIVPNDSPEELFTSAPINLLARTS
jgi:hypothetical protein